MNLVHLYYFRKLVEVGSYSSAAEQLFIAQPTLSLAISSLEKELDAPLLRKKRNGIELTEDGEEFYNAVLTATNALDGCIDLIKKRSEAEYNSIRLGVVYSVQTKEWSSMLREFRRHSSSKINIELKQSITKSLLLSLKSGEIDVAFCGFIGDRDPEITAIPCFTQRAVIVVNKEHPLATRDEISLDELYGQRVISYRLVGGPFDKELGNLLQGHENLHVKTEYADEISLCSMVVADPNTVAIACHSWLIDAFNDCVPIRITDAPEDFHQFFLCYRKRGRKTIGVEAFLDFTKNYEFTNVSPPLKTHARRMAEEEWAEQQ